MKTRLNLFLAFALTLPLAGAMAATNRWDGASGLRPDQMNYRWKLQQAPLASFPTLTNGVLTLSYPSPESGGLYYSQSGEMLAVPTQLVMETRLRLVSGTSTSPNRGSFAIGWTCSRNVGNGLLLRPGGIFLLGSFDAMGDFAVFNTTNDFHTYRIEMDSVMAGGAIRVYCDGTLKLTGANYTDSRQGVEPTIWWGDGSDYGAGVAEWRFFWHNAAPGAAVWGVKSSDSPVPSGPPSTLFHFAEDAPAITEVGSVTLSSVPIDVDGLALNPEGRLFGFQVGIPGSRLISIDKSTAAATTIGPVLAGRDIRGAVSTLAGQLVVLDAAQDQVLTINPATGQELGPAVALTLAGNPFPLSDITDLAQKADGSFMLASDNDLYALEPKTGVLCLLLHDTAPDRQNVPVAHAGLAFSRDATNANTIFTYEVALQDDIYTYQTDTAFTRSVSFQHILSNYNAGRGDLATAPPLLCQITDFLSTTQSQTLKAAFPAGRHAWVEWTSDLGAPAWTPFTNTIISPDPTSGVWSDNATWTLSPSLGGQAFLRVASGLNPPAP